MSASDNGTGLRWKAAKLRARYWFSTAVIRGIGCVPLGLAILASVALVVVAFPSLREGTKAFLMRGTGAERAVIRGTVLQVVVDSGGQKRNVPVVGATIECGGFHTISDSAGNFVLSCYAEHREQVPIVISRGGIECVRRIALPAGQTSVNMTVILP